MKLLFRSSVCVMQYTSRMLSRVTPINLTVTQTAKATKIRFHFKYFVTNESFANKKIRNLPTTIKDDYWKELRAEMLNDFELTDTNVDAQIIDLIHYYNRNDASMDYVKFLKKNNYDLNLSIVGKYFKIYYDREQPLTDKEEEEILKLYDSIREKHELLDAVMCKDCILALSLTKRWEECFDLLDMLKYSDNPSVVVHTAIIAAAYKNDKPEIGWQLISTTITKFPVHSKSFFAHLDYCKRNLKGQKLQEELEKVFFLWREYNVTPTESVVSAYCDVYKSFGYNLNYTKMSKKGLCSSCKKILPETTLTGAEFKLLSVSVLKNVIIGTNLFCSTSPQELKKYMLFIKTMNAYDVVIDGLNVAYSNKKFNQRGSLMTILNVVKQFVSQKKKVLVIGRAHMSWWDKDVMKQLEQKADVYLVKNLSEDDPFLLHVTLVSGPQTYFVSRDLMRSHKAKLDLSLQNLFKRWQLSRQYLFHTNPKSFDLQLLSPILFDIAAQKDEDGWHIPYTESKALILPNAYEQPLNWVCMKKNKNVKEETIKKQR